MQNVKQYPLVSVIIPAYNHEDYIQDALRSVLRQQYNNLEVIVIDDGSTDSTLKKIEEIKEQVSRELASFQVFTQKNAGTCATLNRLVELSSGKYTLLLASDDMLEEGMLTHFVEFLEKNEEYCLVVGKNAYIDGAGRSIYRKRNGTYTEHPEKARYDSFSDFLLKTTPRADFFSESFGSYESLCFGNYIPNGYLMRSSALHKIPPFSTAAPLEDWYLHLQLSKIGKYKYLNIPSFKYRIHGANTSLDTAKMRSMEEKTRQHEFEILVKLNDKKRMDAFIAWRHRSLWQKIENKILKEIKHITCLQFLFKKNGEVASAGPAPAQVTYLGEKIRNVQGSLRERARELLSDVSVASKQVFLHNVLLERKSALYIPDRFEKIRTVMYWLVVLLSSLRKRKIFDRRLYSILYKNSTILKSYLLHYLLVGEKKGNIASLHFDPEYYKRINNVRFNSCPLIINFILEKKTKDKFYQSPIVTLIENSNYSKIYRYLIDEKSNSIHKYLKVEHAENIHDLENLRNYRLELSPKKICDGQSESLVVHKCKLTPYVKLAPIHSYEAKYKAKPYVKKGLDAFIAEFTDVSIVGGTTLVLDKEGNQFYDSYIENVINKDRIFMSPLSRYGEKPHYIDIFKTDMVLEKAIILTHELDFNYYHYIVENLSRLVLLKEANRYADYAIVLTKGLHKNMYSAVRALFPSNELVFVDKLHAVKVKEAIYPSPYCCTFEPKLQCLKNAIFRHDVSRIRELSQYIQNSRTFYGKNYDKIYLSRTSSARAIQNEVALRKLLVDNGFEILDTGNLSFHEQVHIFQNAKIIVAPSGSSLTNIIFCKPNTKILALTSQGFVGIFHLWASLATVANSTLYVATSAQKKQEITVKNLHKSFAVDLAQVQRFLSNCESDGKNCKE